MRNTQKDVENSILILAEKYGKRDSFECLIKTQSLPELIKIIVYEMFVNDFNSYFLTNEQDKDAYKLILQYSQELRKNGFVKFNTKYVVDIDRNGVEIKPGDTIIWETIRSGITIYKKGIVSEEVDSFFHLKTRFQNSNGVPDGIISGGVPYCKCTVING